MCVISVLLPFFASSPPSILAWDDMPELSSQWRPVLAAVSDYPSSDQILVGESLPRNTSHEAVQPMQGVPLYVALVEAKRELVNIAMQVLVAGVVIDAVQTALQHRPDALNAVRRHAVIPDVLARAVNDGFVLVIAAEANVATMIVGMDCCARLDALADFHAQRLGIGSIHGPRHGASAALAHAENGRLADRTATGAQFLAFVLVTLFPADIGLIDLDDAGELAEIAAASFAQPAKDEPSGFLSDTDFLGELHRRDTLTGGDEQVHRVNPLVQWNMRPLKYGAGANCEILLALSAAVKAAFTWRDPITRPANRAARSFRPKQALQIGPGGFLVRKHLEKLKGRNRALAHTQTPIACGKYSDPGRGSKVYNSPK
jgi:hypothetical protein